VTVLSWLKCRGKIHTRWEMAFYLAVMVLGCIPFSSNLFMLLPCLVLWAILWLGNNNRDNFPNH
jgi:hypothetical protein